MANTSFKVRGIEPRDLRQWDDSTRKLYWTWVVELTLTRKDAELAAGLNKDGKPISPGISAKTRKYRRSAMTPTGRGDPSAPPLMPGRVLSRTRSLLTGRAFTTHAEFFWRFDPFTGDEWGKVLRIWANRRAGWDVIGISPEGLRRVQAAASKRWSDFKAGKPVKQKAAMGPVPGFPKVGSTDMSKATLGIGISDPARFNQGRWTGGLTYPEWVRYFRQRTPGSPASNRLLDYIRGRRGPTAPPMPPKPKPKPKPKPPKPAPEIQPPAYDFDIRGSIPAGDVADFRQAIERLPAPMLGALRKAGVRFVFADDMASYDPTVARQRPSGWPEGMTWSHADGMYRTDRKEVVVTKWVLGFPSDERKPSARWAGVLRHEAGHGFDAATGEPSRSEGFRAAYRADADALPERYRASFDYYLQPGYRGPQESFAELLAQHYGGGAEGLDLLRWFPRAAAWVKSLAEGLVP